MSCESVVKKNLGLAQCNELPAMPKTMFTTPDDFEIPIATANDPALLKTFLQDAMLAGIATRIWLWPDFDDMEDHSQEAVYQDTPLSLRKVRDGNYRFLFKISQNLCLHKAFYSHRARAGRVLILDVNDKLIGTLNSAETMVLGLKIQMLDTQKLKFSDGTVSTESPIYVALKNNLELDRDGIMMDGSFVGELLRLTDVTLEIVSSVATKVIVKVYQTCDKTKVNGLVAADFNLFKASDNTAQSITSLTEADGTYTLNGVGLVTGYVNIEAPDDLTIQAYESTGAADFII